MKYRFSGHDIYSGVSEVVEGDDILLLELEELLSAYESPLCALNNKATIGTFRYYLNRYRA